MLILEGVSWMAKPARKPRWKRLNLNVDTSLHDAFKAATAAQGKKMTDVLLEYIRDYVENHPPQPPKKG
jgi:predicted HicB family RNase H-like nuclease